MSILGAAGENKSATGSEIGWGMTIEERGLTDEELRFWKGKESSDSKKMTLRDKKKQYVFQYQIVCNL